MIAFKKPKKNFRKKTKADENDEDKKTNQKTKIQDSVAVNEITEKRGSEKSKVKGKLPKSKSTGLLSFEDELEEGEEFVLKKSRESRKLAQRLREKKKKEIFGEVQEGVESKNNSSEIEHDSALRTKIENANEKIMTVGGDSAEDGEDDEENSFHDIHSGLTTGIIPDAATIFAMKKQRERARQLGTGADFVPLKATTKKFKDRTTGSISRLVREEDEDSEEERIEFKGTHKKSFPALERRKEVAKALEEAHDEKEAQKDVDNDLDLWEEEQIKKGANIPASHKDQIHGPVLPQADFEQAIAMEAKMQPVVLYSAAYIQYGPEAGMTCMYPVKSVPVMGPDGTQNVTVDMVSHRIKERLNSIQQVHRAHILEVEKHRNDVKDYKKSISSLEAKYADVADRFRFYQEMNGYVQDLIDCLNEKVPIIDDADSSMLQLLKQRHHKFRQRRIEDTRDEDSQITGQIQSKGSASMSNIDNFGRDRSKYEENARQRRVAEREGRRNRRRKNRADNSTHHDGMSSDDEELDAEVRKFNADQERLLQLRISIFDDVIQDFSSLDKIKARFEEWRFGFFDSYKEAYIHLCLPKLLSPFLRLEMLDWNPFQLKNKDFEDMTWYKVAAMYGYVSGEEHMDQSDTDLLPLIIEKILIPRLTGMVRLVWDPLSKIQTKLLVSLVQRLADDYPTLQKHSKNTEKLFNEIVQKIKSSIDHEVFIPLYHKGLLDNKASCAFAFLERQFWSAFKLYGNIMEWKDLLSMKVLQELGIDSILTRYLIVALQQMSRLPECLEKCESIIDLLPSPIIDGSDQTPQCLQSLARFLTSLAGRVYKSALGYTEQEKKEAKLMIEKCISLLMHLHAFDFARSIAKDYKI